MLVICCISTNPHPLLRQPQLLQLHTECTAGNFSECLCSKADAEDVHSQWGGTGRSSHELREVVVEPRKIEKDQYSHVRLLEEGQLVFGDSSAGDILAMESQSDSEPFWLVRVVAKHDRLGTHTQFEEWGASIKCAKGGKAVEVTKLMPSSAAAANTFCEDETGRRFFVPASLLRVGGLQLVKKAATRRSTRSRAAVQLCAVRAPGTKSSVVRAGRWSAFAAGHMICQGRRMKWRSSGRSSVRN